MCVIKNTAHNAKSPVTLFRGLFVFHLFCLLMLSASCNTGPEEVLQFYDDGSVSRRHFEVDGMKQGLMTDYYPDGTIKGERNFVDDLQDGRTVWYFPDGSKRETQYFVQGIQQGPDSMWLRHGVLQRVMHFRNGKKDGTLQTWSEKGILILEAEYVMDSLVTASSTLTPVDTTGR